MGVLCQWHIFLVNLIMSCVTALLHWSYDQWWVLVSLVSAALPMKIISCTYVLLWSMHRNNMLTVPCDDTGQLTVSSHHCEVGMSWRLHRGKQAPMKPWATVSFIVRGAHSELIRIIAGSCEHLSISSSVISLLWAHNHNLEDCLWCEL